MRTARIKAEGGGFYHCMSRVIERRMALGPEEQEKFRKMMRMAEDFCGVRILTYAVMGNHWHLLVEVPGKQEISDGELIRRLKLLYGKEFVKEIERQLQEVRQAGDEQAAERIRGKFVYRMGEISEFMKLLKQRYTQWFNKRIGRKGTLWEDRFKSVLVEPPAQSARGSRGKAQALVTMAAYIDLNPVRAGLARDPKEYRYGGYGEAVAGGELARQGLAKVMAGLGVEGNWGAVGAEYRKCLYVAGVEKGVDAEGRPVRAGLSRDEVEKVVAENGKLGLGEVLKCRVRYFSDGVAFGSQEFVEGVFRRHRAFFGKKRKSGARAMRWAQWGGLCTARDLRLEVVMAPQRG